MGMTAPFRGNRVRNAHSAFVTESLFAPGTLVAIVGEGTIALAILFLLSSPFAISVDPMPHADLPRIDRMWIGEDGPGTGLAIVFLERPRSGDWLVEDGRADDSVLPAALTDALIQRERWSHPPNTALRTVRIRMDATLPQALARRAVQAARDADAQRVDFVVLDERGRFGVVVLDLLEPLPDVPDDADVQKLVEAIAVESKR